MLTKIIERLKTGSISNIVEFGSKLPTSPYVCVKAELYPVGRGVRVIAHCDRGSNSALDDYVFNELSVLLSDYEYEDANGNTVTVKDAGEYTDIAVNNDDSTISMERLFYLPLRLR